MGRLGFSPAPNPLDGPVANLLIADLLPAGYTVRGLGSEEPEVGVAREHSAYLLVLAQAEPASCERFTGELLDSGGALHQRFGNLTPDSVGNFSLLLPRRFLGPGRYRIRLSCGEGGVERPIGEYPFRLRFY